MTLTELKTINIIGQALTCLFLTKFTKYEKFLIVWGAKSDYKSLRVPPIMESIAFKNKFRGVKATLRGLNQMIAIERN